MNTATKAPITTTATRGKSVAHTILQKIPVSWVLDTNTGRVAANGKDCGRVVESLPGRLYFFENQDDIDRCQYWASFSTAARAAEAGAVRGVLTAR